MLWKEGFGIACTSVEVIVTRYEKGIAYVRPWDELTDSLEKEFQS